MTPEERDRLKELEVKIEAYKETQDDILKIVKGLEKKSNHFAGGLVILAGVGGIVYWLVQTVLSANIWNNVN